MEGRRRSAQRSIAPAPSSLTAVNLLGAYAFRSAQQRSSWLLRMPLARIGLVQLREGRNVTASPQHVDVRPWVPEPSVQRAAAEDQHIAATLALPGTD